MIKYIFICDNCGFKDYTDGVSPSLKEIKTSKIQGNIPKLDEKNKLVESKTSNRSKLFKCPKCGYSFKYKKINQKEPEDE